MRTYPIALPFLLFSLLLFPGTMAIGVHDEKPPIWTYDFRDVFYDVAVLSPNKMVIVGAGGRVLITHDTYENLWSPRDSGVKTLLTSVSFSDSRNGWAAGHGGVILHTDDGGETWTAQRECSPQNQPLFDIKFVSREVGYACGSYDTFLKTTDGGRTWASLPTGFDNIYNALAFLDEDTGYLVGEFGTVLRTRNGGRSWEKLDLGGEKSSLFGILLLSAQEILVHGISGKIMKTGDGGRSWKDISPENLNRSLFRGAARGEEVVLVGASGLILKSADRGNTFHQIIDEDLTSFAGVRPHPDGGFLCVGERGKILRIRTSAK